MTITLWHNRPYCMTSYLSQLATNVDLTSLIWNKWIRVKTFRAADHGYQPASYNWSCFLERFHMGKLYLDWNFIDQSDNNHSSTSSTQYLPSACEGLDGLFQSIYSYQYLYVIMLFEPWISCRKRGESVGEAVLSFNNWIIEQILNTWTLWMT